MKMASTLLIAVLICGITFNKYSCPQGQALLVTAEEGTHPVNPPSLENIDNKMMKRSIRTL